MAKMDQLEIITPDGKIFFHTLDPHKGITNIGCHPDNDLVIDSPTIGAFEAVIDHQHKPFRFMVLTKEGHARMAGQVLQPDVFQDLRDWQTLELDGFALTLLEDMEVGEGALNAPGQAPPLRSAPVVSTAEVVLPQALPVTSPPAIVNRVASRPVDSLDDRIVASMAEREQTVEVEQPATFEFSVANGGPIVAEFDVAVEGIDAGWVMISPPEIFLNEGARADVRVSIVAPRLSSSTSGVHHLVICITSANYPGHAARLGASLTISPYYEFAVSNLSPAQQTAGWRQRSASTRFSIRNQGNSLATFRTIAVDDENACRFEYSLQSQVNLARQVEVKVAPGETVDMPISITALKRSLVRLRPKQYFYSVTTQSVNDPDAARVITGAFSSRPLFGPFSVLLAILGIFVGVFFLFRPRLDSFVVTPAVIAAGQPVTLSWRAPLFTNELSLKNLPDVIKPGQNQVSLVPDATLTTYTLVGRNWMSRLLSLPDTTLTSQAVLAIPAYPQISTFTIDKTDVILGQPVTIKWAVAQATSVILTVENVPTNLAPADFSGERTITLNSNSLIVLEVRNASGSVKQSEYVRVWGPSDLKVDFKVDPPEVTAGSAVNVSWDVSGSGFTVDTVTVAPFNEPLPSKFSLKFYPTESMYFVLKVKVRDYELSVPKYVTVLPADGKPVIDYFKATPPNLTSSGLVEFSWSVSGATDSIEISNKTGVIQKNLPAQGFANITVSQSATYVMTAKKGKESAAAVVEIQVNNLADVEVSINSMVPQNGILRGDSVFVYFSVTPKVVVPNGPEVSGSVVITDGFDSCEVKLPITSCELVFHRSGPNKKLTATYSGDSNFRRTTSASFPSNTGITVIGSTVTLQNIAIHYVPPIADVHLVQRDSEALHAGPMVGQTGYLQFDLLPVGGSGLTPVQGLYDVLVTDLSSNQTTTLCLNLPLGLAMNEEGVSVGRGNCAFTFGSIGDKQFIIKYRGSEIYEPLNSDPANENQSGLSINVVKAVTRMALLVQNPPNSAQIGQPVTMTLQVMVDAQGGIAVPGVGTVTIKDGSRTYCTAQVNELGMASCSFTPTKSTSQLAFLYTGDGNYGSSDNSGSRPIRYEITRALIDVVVSAVQYTPLSLLHGNPIVGQTLNVTLQAQTTIFHSPVLTGRIQVYLKDAQNPNPTTPKCTILLPRSVLQCAFMIEHGGANQIFTTYSDSDTGNNYQANLQGTREVTVSPAPVILQNISPSAPSTVEGNPLSVSFSVSPSFATSLAPIGAFTIFTDGPETPCKGTLPAQNACSLAILASSASTRTISVQFGDGVDYFVSSVDLAGYPILHRTTTRILSNSPNPPQVFGAVTVFFEVTSNYPDVPGMPVPSGSVTITASNNASVECSASVDAGGRGACQIARLQAGVVNLRASYNPGSAPFAASSSNDFPVAVSKVNAAFVLQAQHPPDSYLRGAASFMLASSGVGLTPTGTAVISARSPLGLQVVCQNVLQLVNGQGTCNITFPSAGDWQLFYTYSGDASYYAVNTVQPLNAIHSVSKYPTTVEISSAVQRLNSTQMEFSYRVTKQLVNGSTLPDDITGSVLIQTIGGPLPLTCTGPIQVNPVTGIGTGSCLIPFPSAGIAFEAVATYSGDDQFESHTSEAYTGIVQ